MFLNSCFNFASVNGTENVVLYNNDLFYKWKHELTSSLFSLNSKY